MPETWQCGHCPLQVAIPDEATNHDGYIDTIVLIREHRFGHIAEAFLKGTNEAIMGLVDDDPTSLQNVGPVVGVVTDDDVAPALAEVDRILRRAV